jgi:hypothetical protein
VRTDNLRLDVFRHQLLGHAMVRLPGTRPHTNAAIEFRADATESVQQFIVVGGAYTVPANYQNWIYHVLQRTTAPRMKTLARPCAFKFGRPVAHSRLPTRSAVERSAWYDLLRAEPDAGTDRGRAWIAVPADR